MNQYRIAAFVLFSLFFAPFIWGQKTLTYNLSVTSPCSTLGVPKQSLSLQVFPNPSNSYIEVISSVYPVIVNLLDIQGRIVLTEQLNQEKSLIQTEGFPKGIYFLNINNEDFVGSIKFTLH
jgi:hypothetical protein